MLINFFLHHLARLRITKNGTQCDVSYFSYAQSCVKTEKLKLLSTFPYKNIIFHVKDADVGDL